MIQVKDDYSSFFNASSSDCNWLIRFCLAIALRDSFLLARLTLQASILCLTIGRSLTAMIIIADKSITAAISEGMPILR